MNYHSDEWIKERLEEHWNELLKQVDERYVLGLFLFGSQNYGTDGPESDIDTRAIVFPTFEDICFNRAPVSRIHVRENGEHIEIKDVRLFFNEIRKQNPNTLEIMFTKYYKLNKEYFRAWGLFCIYREKVARYDKVRAIMTMLGMAKETRKRICNFEEPDSFGTYWNCKALANYVRITEMIIKYDFMFSFDKVLGVNNSDFLRQIKTGQFTAEENTKIIFKCDELLKPIRCAYENKPRCPDSEIGAKLDYFQHMFMQKIIQSTFFIS